MKKYKHFYVPDNMFLYGEFKLEFELCWCAAFQKEGPYICPESRCSSCILGIEAHTHYTIDNYLRNVNFGDKLYPHPFKMKVKTRCSHQDHIN